MKELASLVEYGVAIDPNSMVVPPDTSEFELEADHPGLGDAAYIARRKYLFDITRRCRLAHEPPPFIEYTDEETRIWRDVSPRLDELHVKYASEIYLKAKRELAITEDAIPQLRTLSERVQRETNMHSPGCHSTMATPCG